MPLTPSNRFPLLLRGLLDCIAPRGLYDFDAAMGALTPSERAEAERRAAYYCRRPLADPAQGELTAADFNLPLRKPRHSTYVFPLRRLLNYFPQSVRFNREFGDVDWEPERPTLVKSRPVGSEAGTLLPLDAVRHFRWVTSDATPWDAKLDILVGRNEVHRSPRLEFMARWHGHERTDLGQTNASGGEPDLWLRPRMTIDQQLAYKFIACIEGNDVATNLKWVMSSGSLPVMPTPRMESWFMEGTLQPGVHFVGLRADYSDLLEQMDHYLSHPQDARDMVRANHDYISRFCNPRLEHAAALLTLREYLSAQLG